MRTRGRGAFSWGGLCIAYCCCIPNLNYSSGRCTARVPPGGRLQICIMRAPPAVEPAHLQGLLGQLICSDGREVPHNGCGCVVVEQLHKADSKLLTVAVGERLCGAMKIRGQR